MSAMTLALLIALAAVVAVGAVALHAVHGLRRQITALRAELHATRPGRATVPAA
ncbi:hypothetical protein G3M53_94670, partial [Streptomyces sp. SID7982]|nr:hypothetical protein [Streptomyces sp. SID7982]